jgi:hypothetical protein
MQNRLFFSLFGAICAMVVSSAHSQEKSSVTAKEGEIIITGVIQDTSHNNLPNVTVALASAGQSVTTDGNGEFRLTVAAKKARPDSEGYVDTVILSKDGYVTKKVKIKDYTAPLNARLEYVTRNKGLAKFTEQVSMSHSLGWIRSKAAALAGEGLTDAKFNELVKAHGEDEKKAVTVRIYLPPGVKKLKAAFLISEHGMGGPMMEHKLFRKFADDHEIALVGFLGDPIQRGIGPAGKLEEMLGGFGGKLNHPELATVPVFTFGHSNGTGFSAFYAALRPDRVIGWISYHSGGSWHLIFPGVEKTPGLVMHGHKDKWIENGQEQAIKDLRTQRDAPVSMMIEGEQEHWPSDRPAAFKFILAYCEACIRIRFPDGKLAADATLKPVAIKAGWLGANYDRKTGGMQQLDIAPYKDYSGDKRIANWLPDAGFARIWQHYGKTGKVAK